MLIYQEHLGSEMSHGQVRFFVNVWNNLFLKIIKLQAKVYGLSVLDLNNNHPASWPRGSLGNLLRPVYNHCDLNLVKAKPVLIIHL